MQDAVADCMYVYVYWYLEDNRYHSGSEYETGRKQQNGLTDSDAGGSLSLDSPTRKGFYK